MYSEMVIPCLRARLSIRASSVRESLTVVLWVRISFSCIFWGAGVSPARLSKSPTGGRAQRWDLRPAQPQPAFGSNLRGFSIVPLSVMKISFALVFI